MLDVLGRGLRQAKQLRLSEEAEAAEASAEDDGERSSGRRDLSEPDILDWTGPGVFTDAVLRYLLVRYGVHPKTLSGLVRPLRIGDVVVMPLHSFRADASEGYQGDYRAVWHG
jgi:alpha 1,6-mannosyltransferase